MNYLYSCIKQGSVHHRPIKSNNILFVKSSLTKKPYAIELRMLLVFNTIYLPCRDTRKYYY